MDCGRAWRRSAEAIPLATHEVATGTEVFDWTVPKEWNIRDAYIKDAAGRRVVDFQRNNLHVVNYSAPVRARMSLRELRPHLHVLPEHPDWIPYRTSYYAESWGFCLSQRQLESLADGEYEVVIDSTLQDGSLTYGECVLPGQIADEFLISVHICHPSLANDNLSGVGGSDGAGQSPGGDLASLHLSLPVRARHDRSRSLGSREIRPRCAGEARAWCSPAWATEAASTTSAAGVRVRVSIERWRMCCAARRAIRASGFLAIGLR